MPATPGRKIKERKTRQNDVIPLSALIPPTMKVDTKMSMKSTEKIQMSSCGYYIHVSMLKTRVVSSALRNHMLFDVMEFGKDDIKESTDRQKKKSFAVIFVKALKNVCNSTYPMGGKIILT